MSDNVPQRCQWCVIYLISYSWKPIDNSLDFCLRAPSKPNSVVANTEGEMVAWGMKPGCGTLTPAGFLKGVQFIKTPDYAQVVGGSSTSQRSTFSRAILEERWIPTVLIWCVIYICWFSVSMADGLRLCRGVTQWVVSFTQPPSVPTRTTLFRLLNSTSVWSRLSSLFPC